VILGNQGGYVKLTSSNILVAAPIFSFDVTLENRIAQPIGTTNGFSADAAGSRVFFVTGPTVTSLAGGTVDFVNPGGGFLHDGTATFTASNQPYFKYVGMLRTGEVSATKNWKLRFDASVTTFSFAVLVNTPVKFPIGYIDGNPNVLTLNPSEASSSLGGTVRSAVGNPVAGTISYLSLDPTVASVSAGGVVTAGPARGITYVELSSGSIPNYLSTAINVCASTPTIVSGATVNGTIDANDCYSSFAGNLGRPEPNYRSDMYRVSLTAGQQIAISFTTDGTFTPYLTLVNPLGVIEQSVIGSGSSAVMPAGAAIQQTGIYTIEAGQSDEYATVSAAPGYVGNYSVIATVSP
jgi:hypothetical protein